MDLRAPLASPQPNPLSGAAPAGISLEAILRCDLPVLKHIPKGARGPFAAVLASCLRDVMSRVSWDSLEALLLPRFVLRLPPSSRGGKGRRNTLVDVVRSRCEEFSRRTVAELWSALRAEASAIRPRRTRRGKGDVDGEGEGEGLLRRMRSLAEEGAWGKAAQQLSSSGLHDPNDVEVVRKLRSLHPPDVYPLLGTSFRPPTEPLCGPGSTSLDLLLSAIRSFAPGSAGGPSGLGPQHLQDLLKDKDHVSVSTCLGTLADFCVFYAEGRLPPFGVLWLSVGRLIPLRKKDDGVRPIAIGDTLRRLVAKFLSAHETSVAVSRELQPLQMGVGARGACESLAIGLQEVLNHPPSPAPWVAVAVDISNAFNTLSRRAILEGVREFAPHLEPCAALTLG